MNHTDVLAEAVRILRERDTKYGDVQEMFERTAKLASIILDKEITPYEITVILTASIAQKFAPGLPHTGEYDV